MRRKKILPKLQAASLSDQVHALLTSRIARGEYKPGERILEKELARDLNISRTPVREALLRLEADGLVTCSSRRSYNVRVLTITDIREIYDTLGILEGGAIGAAVSRMTPEDRGLLQEYNDEMARAAERGDLPAFGRWNRKFHDALLSKLENQTLVRLCDSVRGWLYTFPVRHSSLSEWLKKSVREHQEIIRLVAAGDGEAVGSYFLHVHWSFEKNLRYIHDAFDQNGEAAIHF